MALEENLKSSVSVSALANSGTHAANCPSFNNSDMHPGNHRQDMHAPLAYRIDEAVRVSGIGRTTLYRLAGDGKLKTTKVFGRTLILAESLRALLAEGAAR